VSDAAASRAVVRRYEPGDLEAVVALLDGRDPWQRLGYAAGDWRRIFSPPLEGREAWVVERAGSVDGVALVRLRFLAGDYLEVFAIAARAAGRGLGRFLLTAVEREVFERGKNFFVCVSDFNHAARRFYARRGYEQVGTLQNFLVHGSSELLLRKTTGPARAD
jgi:[ribosomal protein S18]-alanine N-acetyltransferase